MFRKILCVSALATFLPACGDGSDPSITASNEATAPAPTTVPAPSPEPSSAPTTGSDGAVDSSAYTVAACRSLVAPPTKPSTAKVVTSFGVAPSDTKDQTAAIQAALDALKPGDWLVFPAGKYLHSKSLRVRVAGVTIWSEGATMVATNPLETAMMMQADNTSLYGFRMHTATTTRGSALQHARIVIAPNGNTTGPRVKNVTVRRNIVENAGAPGTTYANGSSASGIFVYHADTFLVAENTIKRTLADAIHMTGGSINGRVIKNIVRENGDDMIAVVSYMAAKGTEIGSMTSNMATLRDQRLNRNILITDNDVKGQYWGRGITVVGGENVTIQNNLISDTTHGAGVLLARESGYLSFGVKNVIVRNNTIQNVQTSAPVYSVGDKASRPKTGHAGIEVHSLATSEELDNSTFAAAISTEKVLVENNTIDNTLADGMRFGTGAGRVGPAGALGNKMTRVAKTALNVMDANAATYNTHCAGNTDEGNPTASNMCSGSKPAVTGSTLTCTAG
ncbi:MAG TPA: right-handed parallel beta-helix repeat-containing protein [Tahibacter sp.]|nr:right-handed parallel beta-helix repeat-containing protein [Tahibacter sp.]